MRLAFLGTPEVAVPPLRRLVADGHEVALVVSQPDRKRGRGAALVASPVKAAMVQIASPNTVASTTMPTAGPNPFRNRNPTA